MGRELIPARPVLLEHPPEGEGVPQTIRRHESLSLLRSPTRDPANGAPNGYYDGTTMRMALATSYLIDGNCYRWKVRSPERRVVQYWYLPHWTVEPIGTPGRFIDYYRYQIGGQTYRLPAADVSHMRFGLDPQNPRKGMSPIRGVIRELYTDEQAARFSAAILTHVGFPGAVVIPGKDVRVEKKEDREEIRDTFDARFRGEGAGRTIVLGANAEVKFLQWTPEELALGDLRDVPEERVSAVIGIPAAVLGFGTGLQQVKVGATMRELRAMGWEGALIPFLEALAENETGSLLPEFIPEPELERFEIGWDLSRIAALSDIRLKLATTEATMVRARIKMVDEARLALGLPAVGGVDGGFMAQPGVGGPPSGADNDGAEPPSGEESEEAEGLTLRELAVVEQLAKGRTNKAIADSLRTSERTVERVVSQAMRKAGVDSRAELAVWSVR